MIFGVKLTGIENDTGRTLLDVEPYWWDTQWLRDDARFVQTDKTPGYADYDADLSVEEIREIHERFRLKSSRSPYEEEAWLETIQPMTKQIDEALYSQSGRYSHFHVSVYEYVNWLPD